MPPCCACSSCRTRVCLDTSFRANTSRRGGVCTKHEVVVRPPALLPGFEARQNGREREEEGRVLVLSELDCHGHIVGPPPPLFLFFVSFRGPVSCRVFRRPPPSVQLLMLEKALVDEHQYRSGKASLHQELKSLLDRHQRLLGPNDQVTTTSSTTTTKMGAPCITHRL